jgi:hypothetical protein
MKAARSRHSRAGLRTDALCGWMHTSWIGGAGNSGNTICCPCAARLPRMRWGGWCPTRAEALAASCRPGRGSRVFLALFPTAYAVG